MSVRLSGSHGIWSLPDGVTVLGRGKECGICIVEPRLSRSHARFEVNGEAVTIADAGSTNGILVDGNRCTGTIVLGNGSLIVIGPCIFTLTINAGAANPKSLQTLAATKISANSSRSNTEPMDPITDFPMSITDPPTPVAEKRTDVLIPTPTPRPDPPGSGRTGPRTDRLEKKIDPAIAAAAAGAAAPATSSRKRPSTDSLMPTDATPAGSPIHAGPPSGAMPASTPDKPHQPPTDSLRPDDLKIRTTSALAAGPRAPGEVSSGARVIPDVGASSVLLPSEGPKKPGTNALQPHHLSPPPTTTQVRLRRCLAAPLDALQALAITTVFAAPVALIGYALAVHQAGAALVDGLPRLPAAGVEPAGLTAIAWSLFRSGGLERANELIGLFYRHYDQPPFTIVFIAANLCLLIFVLTLLLAFVGATVLKGAPYWHRRHKLVIVERGKNVYLGWGRALGRYALLALLWPVAALVAPFDMRGPHDLIAGSEVRAKK